MLAKNLFALPNQFGNVGNRDAFFQQNPDERLPEFVRMRGRVPMVAENVSYLF
jgi:hypothetical protein